MKLITNSAEIKVTENEDGSKSFQGIGSEVGVENLNGIILTPDCIEFARERYPLNMVLDLVKSLGTQKSIMT